LNAPSFRGVRQQESKRFPAGRLGALFAREPPGLGPILTGLGRDFSDVSPVDGIIIGSRRQKLGVAVDVVVVE